MAQHDLVRSCVVPPPQIRDLRELTRQHTHLARDRARVINRLEKLIEKTEPKIISITSGTLGTSTRAMLEAIVAAERDPIILAEMTKAGYGQRSRSCGRRGRSPGSATRRRS
ncbi:hypothetical protein [Lentzea sp. NPDC004782]|uniref:hypothetical protein n=1 Tax=Lentzea sp. NPDC004782 TaxID=3154458 RepID=UPI0033AC4294